MQPAQGSSWLVQLSTRGFQAGTANITMVFAKPRRSGGRPPGQRLTAIHWYVAAEFDHDLAAVKCEKLTG